MSEEPTWTGRPCPWCGGDGYHNNYLISVGMTACQDCGIELPGEAWDTLSDAAALVRAAERLGAWLQESTSHGLDMVRSRDGLNYVASTVDYVGGGYYHKRANGATPTAALIALAEQVNE